MSICKRDDELHHCNKTRVRYLTCDLISDRVARTAIPFLATEAGENIESAWLPFDTVRSRLTRELAYLFASGNVEPHVAKRDN